MVFQIWQKISICHFMHVFGSNLSVNGDTSFRDTYEYYKSKVHIS